MAIARIMVNMQKTFVATLPIVPLLETVNALHEKFINVCKLQKIIFTLQKQSNDTTKIAAVIHNKKMVLRHIS